MMRLYEMEGYVMIPCPCEDPNCEIEVKTLYGLDINFRVLDFDSKCPTTGFTWSLLEAGKIMHAAYESHIREQEKKQDQSHWDA